MRVAKSVRRRPRPAPPVTTPAGGATHWREHYWCDGCGAKTPHNQVTVSWALGIETWHCPACRNVELSDYYTYKPR